jgi:hypothetical protein
MKRKREAKRSEACRQEEKPQREVTLFPLMVKGERVIGGMEMERKNKGMVTGGARA